MILSSTQKLSRTIAQIKARIDNAKATIEATKSYLDDRTRSADWQSVQSAAGDIRGKREVIDALEWVLGEIRTTQGPDTHSPPYWVGDTAGSGILVEPRVD